LLGKLLSPGVRAAYISFYDDYNKQDAPLLQRVQRVPVPFLALYTLALACSLHTKTRMLQVTLCLQ